MFKDLLSILILLLLLISCSSINKSQIPNISGYLPTVGFAYQYLPGHNPNKIYSNSGESYQNLTHNTLNYNLQARSNINKSNMSNHIWWIYFQWQEVAIIQRKKKQHFNNYLPIQQNKNRLLFQSILTETMGEYMSQL